MTVYHKEKIKDFAITARHMLRKHVTSRLRSIGITAEEIQVPHASCAADVQSFGHAYMTEIELQQRKYLVGQLEQLQKERTLAEAVEQVVEEIACTWFNRIIAIRFMEVNGYLHNREGQPHHLRVLSSTVVGEKVPDILHMPMDAGFIYTAEEKRQIKELTEQKKQRELYSLLFLKQCEELSHTLGWMFGDASKASNYAQLLFVPSYTDDDGIIRSLVDTIPEEYFDRTKSGQVEIMGWMYQYYNSDVKDKVFARPSSQKIKKQDIPAATQLFTPKWIVQYMVQNSLGRLWEASHPASNLKQTWSYYLPEVQQSKAVEKQLDSIRSDHGDVDLGQIKLIDPSMGSGHILVYAFDMLMQMYQSVGYPAPEAAQHIVEHNLFGLDIDYFAMQLTRFALMMKVRQYDPHAFSKYYTLHIYAVEESNQIDEKRLLDRCKGEKKRAQDLHKLLELFYDAKEYGSILKIDQDIDLDGLRRWVDAEVKNESEHTKRARQHIGKLLDVAQLLSSTYHVVVTNPPYMGARGMNSKLSSYVREHYPHSKSDLFAVFIEKGLQLTKKDFYMAMLTMHSWMFLKSFEQLRRTILTYDMQNMAHLGARAFDDISGEVVQTTAFVLQKTSTQKREGSYVRLTDYTGEAEKQTAYKQAIADTESDLVYHTAADNFHKIPGMPVAYWASSRLVEMFQRKKYSSILLPAGKMSLPTIKNT